MTDIDPTPRLEPGPRFSRWEYVVALLALSVVAVLTFPAYTLTGGARLLAYPWIDGQCSEFVFHPWDQFLSSCFARGEIPLWNPHEAGGNPFLANYQSSIFYPLKILIYLFGAVNLYLLSRLVLAGVFMFRFLRFIRLSRAAAALGGIAFMLSSHLLLFLNLPHVNADALIPLVLFAVAAYLRFGGPGRFLFAALCVAVVVFGGHPESTFYVLLFTSGFALFEGWVGGEGVKAIPLRRRVFGGGAVFACGVLLGAAQLLPFIEYLGHAWHIHPIGVGGIHRDALGFIEFVTARIRPGAASFPMAVGSVAFLLALYAATSIRRLRARAVYFAGVAVVFGGLYLGVWPFYELGRLPLIGEAGNIKYPAPVVTASLAVLAAIGFERLRIRLRLARGCRGLYVCAAAVVALGFGAPVVVVLAGGPPLDLGAAALSVAPLLALLAFVRLHQRGLATSAAVTAAGVAAVPATLWSGHAGFGGGDAWWWAGGVIVLPVIAWLAASIGRSMPRWRSAVAALTVLTAAGVGLLVAVAHVGSARVGTGANAPRWLPEADAPPEFVRTIRRANERMGGGPFRITGEHGALPANQATVWGLDDVRAFDALYVDRFFQYLNVINDLPDYREVLLPMPSGITQGEALKLLQDSGSDWLFFERSKRSAIKLDRFRHPLVDLLGVRFFLYGPYYSGPTVAGPGLRTIYERHGFRVVANDHALPRAFLVHGAEVCASPREAKARIGRAGFDGRRVAVLESPPPGPLPGAGAATPGERAEVTGRGTDWVRVAVEADAPAILVLTDNFYPGWTAQRTGPDGDTKPMEIMPCDLAFRGVYVPAGRHQITFRFRPASVYLGAGIGVSVLALLLAACGFAAVRCRRRGGGSHSAPPERG